MSSVDAAKIATDTALDNESRALADGEGGVFAPDPSPGPAHTTLSASARRSCPSRSNASSVELALDPAASEFFNNGAYRYEGEGRTRSVDEQAKYLAELVARYPIVSIEDGMNCHRS